MAAEPRDTPYPTFDEVSSVMRWGCEYYAQITAHLEKLAEKDMSSPMYLPWAEIVTRELGRPPEALNIGQTMLQLPLHSQYHRGQINARLREVGGEPPRRLHCVDVAQAAGGRMGFVKEQLNSRVCGFAVRCAQGLGLPRTSDCKIGLRPLSRAKPS